MNKKDVKTVVDRIGHHAGILVKGFVRMAHGAATAGLIALAIYGFAMIPTEGGYIAVCDFIGSIATVCVAFASVYAMGCSRKRGAKK